MKILESFSNDSIFLSKFLKGEKNRRTSFEFEDFSTDLKKILKLFVKKRKSLKSHPNFNPFLVDKVREAPKERKSKF